MRDVVAMPLQQIVMFESAYGPVAVEVDEPVIGPAPAGIGDAAVRKASSSLEAALETIRATAMSVNTKLQELDRRPAEVTVTFGLKLTAGLSALAAASGEATITVTMRWTDADGDT